MAEKAKQTVKRMQLKFLPALKDSTRIVLPVGAGALASVIGGELATRSVDAVGAFADTDYKRAFVDAAAGSILSAIGLAIYAKVTSPAKAIAKAPYVFGGAIGIPAFKALGPMVVDGLMGLIDKAVGGSLAPAGAYANMNAGLQGRLPGGAYANMNDGLQGRLPGGWGDGPGGPNYGPNAVGNRLPAGLRRI